MFNETKVYECENYKLELAENNVKIYNCNILIKDVNDTSMYHNLQSFIMMNNIKNVQIFKIVDINNNEIFCVGFHIKPYKTINNINRNFFYFIINN